jgi:integrase/recombinase XerD
MAMLRKGFDRSVIALWLGHERMETTQIYLHSDMQLKQQALAHLAPSGIAPGRYRPGDALLAFLEACDYADSAQATNQSATADTAMYHTDAA